MPVSANSWQIILLGILAALRCGASASAQDVPFHNGTVVKFASTAQGMEILSKRDRFLNSLSAFDRQSRVETDKEVSEQDFLEFIRSHVRPWADSERVKLSTVIASLQQKMAALKLPFPQAVWLVKTTGREEGNAAYCRGTAIVLPQDKVQGNESELERLLAHELFHILSANDSEFRAKCYKAIGFRIVLPIEFPPTLQARKITNPDGPSLDALIDVMLEGEVCSAVPILYSERTFDASAGGPFFKYVTFRLLIVEEQGGKWRPRLRDGQPWLVTPGKVPDFGRQIGANTGYIIHPDEILADNFVHLVFQTPGLRSPEVIERLRESLRS
jgi:hypothetical protein